jgi:flavin reductase (DIM6/NTAB) family NADH-FMN oxidoreductase RutF
MENITLSKSELDQMATRDRAHLVNSLSGFKSANLIGSTDHNGNYNLSIVSSVIHLGSNPPLLGFIVRPHQVERHSLENILSTGFYTINAVSTDVAVKAHQTSARYPKQTSEFDAVDLTSYIHNGFKAPFVLESPLKMAMKFIERITIESNQTEMIIGEIQFIETIAHALMPDGYLDIEALELVTVSGLDSYHVTSRMHRLSYAKTQHNTYPLTREGEPSSWEAFKNHLSLI